MSKPGATFGIVGALSAFPRRLAARAVATKGGQLRRGVTRKTSRLIMTIALVGIIVVIAIVTLVNN